MESKRSTRKKWIIAGVLILFVLAAIQFIRPSLDHPPVTADLAAPPEVRQIFQRACYDCHSNETRLAWFDRLQPAYSLVADHIKEGRSVLNFSNWDSLSKGDQKGKLFESLNQMVYHTMPLQQYLWLHRDAKISASDIRVLKDYLRTLAYKSSMPDSGRQRGADEQYRQWAGAPAGHTPVRDAPNGLVYIDGWRDWAPVSTTERFDNGTLRVITGNDIAIRAIREHHTNPWPNGSTFAKIAWEQLSDADGMVSTGKFLQVEFMVKDAERYAATGGWGWGRWKGTGLTPYGKNALFTTECVNCHKPMHDNDLVFTTPVAQLDTVLHGDFRFSAAGWKVVSSGVDRPQGRMFTVYGNDAAIAAARSGSALPYPNGAVQVKVTWAQKEDEHWFGANIPGRLLSVEKLANGNVARGAVMP